MKTKDLKNHLYTDSNKELIGFIKKEYYPPKEIHVIKNKVDTLNKLSNADIEQGIARMKGIQEGNDISKFLGGFIAFIIAVLTSYGIVWKAVLPNYVGLIIVVILYLIFFELITTYLLLNLRQRTVVAYFNSLLEFALENKKK